MNEAGFNGDLMFGELLAYLRQHGFRIGVDHYLRLQQLLERVGTRCAPHELRTLLCPIFATNRNQQEQFYRVFDSYFDFFQSGDEPGETTHEELPEAQTLAQAAKPQPSRRRWLYVATPVALALLVIVSVLILRQKPTEQSANQANTSGEPEAARTSEPATTTEAMPDIAGTTQPDETQPATPTTTPVPESGFYERNRTVINASIILAPLLLFLLYEWYRFARRKLLIQKQQARKPPFVWPIRVNALEEAPYDSEQLLTAARLMRRRQMDEFRRLDVEATVNATIERLGFPDFRHKSDSRVPEYLVLIDRASFRDHQAQFFEELTQALEHEGVFVVRYFFDGDPRVCRDETGAGVVQLAELQNKLSGHRLLIFGNGEKLLDPISGRLEGWTAIFNHWQDRALLTVENPLRWGLKEIALAQSFIVLPATLDGLLALVDLFETTVQSDLTLRSRARAGFEDSLTGATPEEAIAELRSTLGEDAFQWLAACAVYTELQWNLTLFIGSLPSMPQGLVTEANLLKLIRLPWFRTGAIPDELRWHLINELAPERQRSVRAALIELLERDPAPPETFAADQYRLNLFAQRWLQSQTRRRLRELQNLIKKLPRSQIMRDLTLIRFLESSKRSPLDFLLPDRLRKTFYHRGVPAFGLKTGARLLVTLLFIGLAWVGIKALAPSSDDRTLTAQGFDAPGDVLPEQTPSSRPAAEPESETSTAQDSINESRPQPESQTQNQPAPQTGMVTTEPLPPPERAGEGTLEGTPEPPERAGGGNIEGILEPPERARRPVSDPQPAPTGEGTGSKPAVTVAEGRNEPTPKPTASTASTTTSTGATAPSQSPIQSAPTPTPRVVSVVAGGVLNGRATSLPKPFYPSAAKESGISGMVIVEVLVDESGKVINAKVVKGHILLQQAAVQAAYKARFPQTIISGQPAKLRGLLSYSFKLVDAPDTGQRPPATMPGRRPPAGPGGRPPR